MTEQRHAPGETGFEKEATELLVRFTVPGTDHLVADLEHVAHDVAEAMRAVAEREWYAGLDFAGDCLRAGCSLTEAATGNPHTKPTQEKPHV